METWPEVVRWLVLVVGGGAGLMWTSGRLFRPWMRDEARTAAEWLYGRLQDNDFKHIEGRFSDGLAAVSERFADGLAAVSERFADGLAAVDERLDRMDRRHDEALGAVNERLDRMDKRLDRMDDRMDRMDDRLVTGLGAVNGRLDQILATLMASGGDRPSDMEASPGE